MIVVNITKEKIFDQMNELLGKLPTNYFADILYDSRSVINMRQSNSGVVTTAPSMKGYVFRVFDGLHWIEISDSSFSMLEKKVNKIISQLSHYDNIELDLFPAIKMDEEIYQENNFTQYSLQKKLDLLNKQYNRMKKMDSHVINPILFYSDSITERIYVNTEGSQLRQLIPRVRLFIQPVVKVEGNIDFDFLILAGEGGWEILDGLTDDALQNIIDSAIEIAQAPLSPAGRHDIILDSSMSGLIAHESFGHGLESDQIVRERSYLSSYYNKRVAAEIVNISDAPNFPKIYGSYLFDDEGILTEKTPLVENGIFTHYLHSRTTASLLNDKPRGNGRRQSFMHPVYPRMSNTYFEEGDYSLDEMISEMKEGVLLEKGVFGMEDPLGGGIQCTSLKGYIINNGEKVQIIKGSTISGNVLELLQNITAISKGYFELDAGTCGKGAEDLVPVSSGGPFIKVENALISPG